MSRAETSLHFFSQMRSFTLLSLLIIAIAVCAPAKDFEFTVESFFTGSWKVQRKELTTGEVEEVKVGNVEIYNVSMNAADSMLFSFVDAASNEVKEEQSFTMAVADKMTVHGIAAEEKTNPFRGVQFHFQVLTANSTYVRVWAVSEE